MTTNIKVVAALIAAAFTGSALAEVTAEEAKQLGGSVLTAWGAEKAGNKDGTIPEYTGTPLKVPAGWDSKEPGRRPDPFNEKPLFSITAQNAGQYADRLPDGLKEVFKKYPSFRMDIYPTHRTAIFPKYVLDNTMKNATTCKAVDKELRVEGCYGGVPFPIPKTGNQVMWNHLLEYEGVTWNNPTRTWIVPPSGGAVMVGENFAVQNAPFFDPKRNTPAKGTDIYWRVRLDNTAPARMVGGKFLVIDLVNSSRRAYQYVPGQRRVKLAPDLAYDTPSPYSGGSSNMDDAKIFLGSLDRYDFKLIGKKEKYIPYNLFNLTDRAICPEERVTSTKNFANPDCVRWELHRVWVVQASLKPEVRHIYHKRVFYWDEDGYVAGLQESYDAADTLYRITWGAHVPMWDNGASGGSTASMDLQTGVWSFQGLQSGAGMGSWSANEKPENFYGPEALAGEGVR